MSKIDPVQSDLRANALLRFRDDVGREYLAPAYIGTLQQQVEAGAGIEFSIEDAEFRDERVKLSGVTVIQGVPIAAESSNAGSPGSDTVRQPERTREAVLTLQEFDD